MKVGRYATACRLRPPLALHDYIYDVYTLRPPFAMRDYIYDVYTRHFRSYSRTALVQRSNLLNWLREQFPTVLAPLVVGRYPRQMLENYYGITELILSYNPTDPKKWEFSPREQHHSVYYTLIAASKVLHEYW